MNLLQLAQRLRTECGVSGTDATVVGASGEWGRLCNWTADAWRELQEMHTDWEWMRKDVAFNTVVNQGEYAPAGVEIALTNFGTWRKKSFRIYLASAGVGSELPLGYKDYKQFRDYYLLGSRKITYSRPTEITIAPNKNLILGLAPSEIYTVSGEYYTAPTEIALDADTPEMPSRFHLAVVYKAMMSYGAFESAPEVYNRGKEGFSAMRNRLEVEQLPQIIKG